MITARLKIMKDLFVLNRCCIKCDVKVAIKITRRDRKEFSNFRSLKLLLRIINNSGHECVCALCFFGQDPTAESLLIAYFP